MLLPYGRLVKYSKRLVVDAKKIGINKDITRFGAASNRLDKRSMLIRQPIRANLSERGEKTVSEFLTDVLSGGGTAADCALLLASRDEDADAEFDFFS